MDARTWQQALVDLVDAVTLCVDDARRYVLATAEREAQEARTRAQRETHDRSRRG